MWRNTFLFIFTLIFNLILGQGSANSGLQIGDSCVFNETLNGFCQKVDNCDYLKEHFRHSKIVPDDFKKSICLSRGFNQLVCCPMLFQPSDLQTSEEKFTKFDKVICKDKEPQIAITVNIAGEQLADVGEFQFQAVIGYKSSSSNSDEYTYECGGALIAEDIVITSAYCLRNPRKPRVVKIGATSLNNDEDDHSESEVIKIDDSKTHPEYSIHTNNNDIGLIKLIRPFNNKLWSINPICITTHDEDLPKNFTVTGFMKNSRNAPMLATWLHKQTCNLHPNSDYRNLPKFKEQNLKIYDTQACVVAFNDNESCFGDLGGPIIYEKDFINFKGTINYLYGIKSLGFGCNSSLPSIYTKVYDYVDWIEETMEQLDAGGPQFG